jgi:hypothetical protein
MQHAVLVLAIACGAFLATMIGGLLAISLGDRLHLVLGFSAWAVIGVAFFDLMPEAMETGAGCVQILSHILSGGSSGQAVCNSTVCLLSRSIFM